LIVLAAVIAMSCESAPTESFTTPAITLPVATPHPDVLPPGRASAEGFVRDTEGVPIAGAFVGGQPAGPEPGLATDENGHYSLDGYELEPGINTITVAKEGFETQVLEVTLRGQERTRVDFVLVRTP
jgi:hypothetical protein